MKKTLLLMISAMVVAAASAVPQKLQNVKVNHQPLKAASMSLKKAHEDGLVAKPKKVSIKESELPISDAPAGRLIDNMYVKSSAYGLGWGDIYYQDVDGGLGGVVEGDDGFLYVKGPISQAYVWGLGTPWIKCEYGENNTVVMHTPQIYALDYGDPYYICKLKYDANEGTFVFDPEDTDVKFTWKDDVLTYADSDICVIGLTDATNAWFYMADWDIVYSICEDQPIALPDGLAKSVATINYLDDAEDLTSTDKYMSNAYLGTTDLYFDNFNTEDNNAVIKGELIDGKYVFPSKQYLGVNLTYNSHIYALTADAKIESTGSEAEGDLYTYFNFDETATFALSAEGETVTTLSAEYPASILINCGRSNIYYITGFVAPTIELKEDKAMTPADPIFSLENVSHSHNSGFDRLSFTIPTVSTKGEDLNVANLYYVIYYNGEPYTFTPDLFVGLTSDITIIPYAFSDSYYDIYLSSGSKKHTIYFYDYEWTTLGIQSIYYGGNQENRSNIVTVTNDYTGVNNAQVAEKDVDSIELFDLTGRKLQEGEKGFAIKRIKYADGSENAVKVLVK